ncbi:unnamed protein product [Rotaria magnacalcarata]|uniref:Uncharacterized protein n=1 Tax=Rotaria magnacalcarata TaxID=392030 RepID=A0A816TDB2_9BILA|nr:unnamed protein product [Rotaria magnacalcarata]
MAATSYTAVPSNTYAGLGSQGDLYHSANYGTYDSGVGTLIHVPSQYSTNNYGNHLIDNQLRPPYSDDYLQPSYSNDNYITQEPQYYTPDRFVQQSTYSKDGLLNSYPNSQSQIYDDRSTIPHSIDENNTKQPMQKTIIDDHHVEPNDRYQPTQQQQLPVLSDNKNPQSKSSPPTNSTQSDNQIITNPPKQTSTNQNHVSSNGSIRNPSETTLKSNNPPIELKTNKSTKMRAAAIKQKEDSREQKQRDSNIAVPKKKMTPPKPTKVQTQPVSDVEHNDAGKPKRNKKKSNSVPKQRTSRRDDYQTEDNNSSGDDNNNRQRSRSQSNKRTPMSDYHQEKNLALPPIRRGRGPPIYDPIYDYPLPPRYPLRGRYPYHDEFPPYGPYPYPIRSEYRYRHMYEEGYDTPPYLPSSHAPYDGFFDYEKRKPKSKSRPFKDKKETNDDRGVVTENETEREDEKKSQVSKKPKPKTKTTAKTKNSKTKDDDDENEKIKQRHINQKYEEEGEMLEMWRQERNDYLKQKFKPTVHDVLYSQQWMKTDSYLENQRRRALRDIQGYYFPYKKYTLKDYKDLQKHDSQNNPYASLNEPSPDRKERARKRQEYASQIDKQSVDPSAANTKTPREALQKKVWHINNSDPDSADKLSKRERALEYAKIQVVKKRPQKSRNDGSNGSDPTEQYVNGLFPQTNDDDEGSDNGRFRRNNQSAEEYDD